MRLTILTIGSRGDVQPFIALGRGLKDAGYEVRLATHQPFEAAVRLSGLDYAPIEGNPNEVMASERGQAWLESGSNPVRFIREFAALGNQLMSEMTRDCWAASEGADALILSTLAFPGYHIAEKLRVPCFSALLQPATRTREHPAVGFNEFPFLRRQFNWLSFIVSEQMIWQLFRRGINQWRVETLGLPPVPFKGLFDRLYADRVPFLYGFSPLVVLPPRDYPEWHHVTGYWFLDGKEGWQPPAALVEFLRAGPPPVYIGFGSMAGAAAKRLIPMAVEALKMSGQRGILLDSVGRGEGQNTEYALRIPSVPHEWLFPQMAAVVHHGGAGTTAAGLRAGVPSIVVPFFADQPFWAGRVEALGVGPKSIPRKDVTTERLAAAITAAVSDKAMRERAAVLGQDIRAEDGVARAVEVVGRYLTARR